MNQISLLLISLSGVCSGLAPFNPEHKFVILFVGLVFFVIGLKINQRVLKPTMKKELKPLYACLKTASVCQFVGLENLNSDINGRYQKIFDHIIKIANNQNETDKAEILKTFNKLGRYSDRDLVTVAEFFHCFRIK